MEESKDLSSRSQLEMYSCGHEDRISSLPDEVLLIILSFLTLKKMVKTSILSSRWENLWLNTPVLNFHAPSPIGSGVDNKKRKDYVVWVDHVLRQHKGRHLKEFKIGFYLNIDYQKDIDRWLEFALARKVEILELNFLLGGFDPINATYNYAFPDCFLKFCGGTANLDGNNQFDLKCLKSLSLKNVDVTGEAIDSFLLNCPFLERLEVVSSCKLVNLVISDPTLVLKYLQIKHCIGLTVLSISNFNLISLDISSVEDLTLKDLSMLVELSIDGNSDNLNHSFFQAASCLSRLEALTLDAEKLKDVTQLPNLAQVTKLKRLVIKVKGWGDESLTMLLSFMKSFHHLEEFVLELSQYIPERAIEAMCQAERLSSSSSLKVFEFRGYYGRVSDDELIMRVVENAPSLEKIIIETLALLMRKHNIGVLTTAREARSFTSKKIEYLRESKCIPPHVNVLVR